MFPLCAIGVGASSRSAFPVSYMDDGKARGSQGTYQIISRDSGRLRIIEPIDFRFYTDRNQIATRQPPRMEISESAVLYLEN